MIKYRTVMLIDDDEVSNFLNTQILHSINIADDILIAMNGQEALEMLKQFSEGQHGGGDKTYPELIFLDLNMPVMNGLEFLQAFGKDINTVVLTSSTNQKDVEAVHHFPQVKYYLSKPLTADKVAKALMSM